MPSDASNNTVINVGWRPRWYLLIAVPFLAAVAAVAWVWWNDEPGAFRDSIGHGTSVVPVGESFHFSVTPDRNVQLVAVEPEMADGSARADVSASICVPGDESDFIVTVGGDLQRFCPDLRTVEHQRIEATEGGPYLLVTVVPREDGEVQLDGVRITYTLGGRRHTEVVESVWRLRTAA